MEVATRLAFNHAQVPDVRGLTSLAYDILDDDHLMDMCTSDGYSFAVYVIVSFLKDCIVETALYDNLFEL